MPSRNSSPLARLAVPEIELVGDRLPVDAERERLPDLLVSEEGMWRLLHGSAGRSGSLFGSEKLSSYPLHGVAGNDDEIALAAFGELVENFRLDLQIPGEVASRPFAARPARRKVASPPPLRLTDAK